MNRAVPLLVVVFVLLAGCGGTPPAPTTSPSPGETTTAIQQTPAPSPNYTSTVPPTTTISSIGGLELPKGFSATGVTPGDPIIVTQLRRVSNVSHTVTYVQGNESVSGTMHIEPNASEASINYTMSGFDLHIYTKNGSGVRRWVKSDGNVSLKNISVSVTQIQTTLVLPAFNDPYRAATYNHTGTTTYEGIPVHRYEVTGIAEQRTKLNASNVSDISGHLLVSERGLVVDFEFTFTHKGRERRYIYKLSDIGNTTVDRPDWATGSES